MGGVRVLAGVLAVGLTAFALAGALAGATGCHEEVYESGASARCRVAVEGAEVVVEAAILVNGGGEQLMECGQGLGGYCTSPVSWPPA